MKKYLGLICLLYSGIVFYVWFSNSLNNYLAPSMQIYIKISSILMIIFGILLIVFKDINYKFKVSDIVLILPLIMIFIAGDGSLSLDLASNRMGNFNKKITTIEEDEIDSSIIDNNMVSTNIDFEIIDENYDYLANYLTFNEKALKFKGKSIKVKGFSITKASYLPTGYFALGKYIISCCAADATFGGFYIKYDVSKIKDGAWYEIEGILNSGKDPDGHSIMYINVTNIKEVNVSSNEQYAYPCYSYDDMCKEVRKYDIDFEV